VAVYALVDENNIVIDIKSDDTEWVKTQPGRWIETDPHTRSGRHDMEDGIPLRKNFAQIGYTYDEVLDAFIPPKPIPSWVIDPETGQWIAPIPYPTDGWNYTWDENEQAWIKWPPNQ